jgi:beta-glucosidase
MGVFAPGRSSNRATSPEGNSSTEPWIVAHNLLLAHAHAVKIYREEFNNGQIGITLNGDWCEPFSHADKDGMWLCLGVMVAAQRRLEFWIGHYADPVYLTGDYPECMRRQLGDRLPKFTPEESALLKGSSDFYGMNTYTSDYIKDKSAPPDILDFLGNVEITKIGPDGKPMGPQGESFWLQDSTPSFQRLISPLGIPQDFELDIGPLSVTHLRHREWFFHSK